MSQMFSAFVQQVFPSCPHAACMPSFASTFNNKTEKVSINMKHSNVLPLYLCIIA